MYDVFLQIMYIWGMDISKLQTDGPSVAGKIFDSQSKLRPYLPNSCTYKITIQQHIHKFFSVLGIIYVNSNPLYYLHDLDIT